MERRSLVEYLDGFLPRGDACAYIQPRGYRTIRWSYRQVAESAFQFARELESRGISRGDRVVLWAPNSAEWVTVFWGCALRGAIVVPLDDAATPDFALRVAQSAGARLLVCSSQHLQSSLPALLIDDLPETLQHHSPAPYPPAELTPTDTLEIVFTSGATAEPKGVVITHGNVLANLAPLETEIRKYLKYERFVHPVRFLNLLPLSHVFGQFLGIFLPPLLGGTVVFHDSLNPSEVIATIRRERVSVLVAVPRILQSLKEKIERDLQDRSQLEKFNQQFRIANGKHFLHRWCTFRRIHRQFGWKFWAFISGGATLDPATEEFWNRLGYAVIQGYGLTETTSLISVNHPFKLSHGSIGKVLAGRELKLAEDGEILVRGGGIAAAYWSGGESQPVAGDAGWYRTGDIGELDAQGNLFFKGRKKEVIVTPAGMNIYPEDLERALRSQPEVKDCVVIPLPRDGNAEPCAVLILRDPGADPQSIVQRANQSLAEYQRITNWFVWPGQDFPRTSTQKPLKNSIQQTVLAQFAQPWPHPPNSSPLAELIGRITGRTPAHLIAASHLESDLNLSSLDRLALLSALEDRYQLDLSETSFSAVNTVGDLEGILRGQPPPRTRFHYAPWAQRWPVTWLRSITNYLLLRPAVFLLGRPRVEVRENLRGIRGPVLVICNHISEVDVGLVIAALPAHLSNRIATAASGEALELLHTPSPSRNPLGKIYDRIKWLLGVSLLNLFPLPREAGFRHSFAYAGECVDRGYSILVFPEGRHTTDGRLGPFRAGIGLLANKLNIPIVPMRIDGLFELKQAQKRFARPGQIRVKIGAPIHLPPHRDPEWVAHELQKRVQNL